MKVDIGNVLEQIQQAKQRWEALLPRLNVANNPLAPDISNAFEQVEAFLGKLPNELEVNGLHWQIATQQLRAIAKYSGDPNQIQGIASWLWTFNNALLDALPLKYVAEEKGMRVTKQLEAKIRLLESYLDDAQKAKERIETVAKQWDELEERVKALSEVFDAAKIEIDKLKETANEAADEAKSSAASAKEQLKEMTKLLQGIEEATERQQALFREFEEQRDQISAYLKNANKVGLAKSFQDKRKELTWTWRGWAALFVLGICVLGYIGYHELLPLLKANTPDPVAIGFRLALSGPVIWFTWFAARQYSHVLRLSEDYAFKEAAAMAFVGYRDEVDNDPEMVKLLQLYAIQNFGENPAKMLLKKADSSSPFHEMVDKALDKIRNAENQ